MSKPEIFDKATPFKDITLGGDNPQLDSILDELVVVEGFSPDGDSALLIAVVKENGDTVNIWSSSKVVKDTLNKIPKGSFPISTTFRELRAQGGMNYYALE